MKKLGKNRKENKQVKIENIFKEKFSVIYIGFMMVVFSFYYQDAFFDIAQAKRSAYLGGTGLFIVIMLALSMYSIVKDFKTLQNKKLDVIEILGVLLMASWGIGMIFAVDRQQSFLGEYNKCTGLIMYLFGAIAVLYVSKYLKWCVELIWSFLFATTVVYILQILNRFNIDPLGMYNGIADYQRNSYISLLGHGNYNAAYNCLTIVIGMVMFYLCKEKISKIVYGCLLLVGFAGSICCCADSVYLGIGVGMLVLLGYSCAHPQKWWDFVAEIAIFVLANMFVGILYTVGKNKTTGFWGGSLVLLDIKVIIAEIIVVVAFALIVKFAYSSLKKYSSRVTKIYVCIILASLALGILGMIIATVAGINEGPLAALCIDDDWGTTRGSIWKMILSLMGASSIGNMLFGYGFNMVREALELILGDSHSVMGEGIADAHNIVLNSLATSGIIGTLLLYAIIIIILRRGFLLMKENEKGLFIVAGLLVFLAQGMINGPQSITTPVIITEFGVFWSLVRCEKIGIGRKSSEE